MVHITDETYISNDLDLLPVIWLKYKHNAIPDVFVQDGGKNLRE